MILVSKKSSNSMSYCRVYLKNQYTCIFAAFPGFLVPDSGLHFTYMSVTHEEHAEPALSYAPANGIWKLTVKKSFVEGKLPPVVAAG